MLYAEKKDISTQQKGDFTLKKIISSTLCLILLLALVLPTLTACGNKDIFRLGKYTITEKEYVYLTGMFKKQVLVSLSPDEKLTDEDLSMEVSSGVTLSEYINYKYRASFEQSILTLLYSQLMFDELGLSLTDDEKNSLEATAEAVALYYGADNLADFGFDKKTLLSIYEKQYKENKVRAHILGENDSNVTSEQIESYYLDNYLRYKTIIINTVYRIHTDSAGVHSFVYLTEDEKERQETIVVELKELLINKNMDYNYTYLKDDLNLTYDELWEKYSDDKFYPGGCYDTSSPSQTQLANDNVLSAAYQSKVGEIKTVTAKRFFEESGSISGENGTTTVKPGDYFEYGTVFVKRLALDSKPYERPENSDFFPEGVLKTTVANYVYYKTLMDHEATNSLTIDVASKGASITFDTVKANELDYYYIHGKTE